MLLFYCACSKVIYNLLELHSEIVPGEDYVCFDMDFKVALKVYQSDMDPKQSKKHTQLDELPIEETGVDMIKCR